MFSVPSNGYTPNWMSLGLSRDQVLNALWDSELLYLTLVTEEGFWVYPSKGVCKLLGYTKAELQEMTYMDVTDPLDVRADVKSAEAVAHGEINSYVMTKRYITKAGKRIWIKLMVTPLTDKEGNFKMYLSQILPFDTPISQKESVLNTAKGPSFSFKHFVKDNAVKLLPILGSLFLAIWGAATKWVQVNHENQELKERIENLESMEEK